MNNSKYRTYSIKILEDGFKKKHKVGGVLSLEESTLLDSFLNIHDSHHSNTPGATDATHGESEGDSLQDLEDLASTFVPLTKYKKKGKLSVTEVASQLWCEKQLELSLLTGRKRVTPSMVAGVERHEALELADHDIVNVEVFTREDALGLRLFNTITLLDQLMSQGRVREIWVFGIWCNIVVRGVIDQMELVDMNGAYCNDTTKTRRVLISDTKTRVVKKEPSNAQKRTSCFQLEMYWCMVNALRSQKVDLDVLIQNYECDRYARFETKELNMYTCLDDILKTFQSAFCRLPELYSDAKIEYEFQGETFSYSMLPCKERCLQYTIHNLLDWWQGVRESEGVLLCEKWKCHSCEFLDMCVASPLSLSDIQKILKERTLKNEEPDTLEKK